MLPAVRPASAGSVVGVTAFWILFGVAAASAVVDWAAVGPGRTTDSSTRPSRRCWPRSPWPPPCSPPATPTSSTGSGGSWPRWPARLVGDVLLMLPAGPVRARPVGVPGRPRPVHRRAAAAAVTARHPTLRLLDHRAGGGRRGRGGRRRRVPAYLIFRSLLAGRAPRAGRARSPSTWSPSAPWPCWRPTSACRPPPSAPRCSWCPTPSSPSTGSCGRSATATVAVHVTYHLAQVLLVLSLLR